jgi:hypothetical protein
VIPARAARAVVQSAAAGGATRSNSSSGTPEVDLVADPERDGDHFAQPPRQAAARRSPHDLAEQEAEGLGVVAEAGARPPPGLRLGEHRAHVVPVAQILDRRLVRRGRHTSGVQQHVLLRHEILAVGAELGPDVGRPHVICELAPLHQHMAAVEAMPFAADAA